MNNTCFAAFHCQACDKIVWWTVLNTKENVFDKFNLIKKCATEYEQIKRGFSAEMEDIIRTGEADLYNYACENERLFASLPYGSFDGMMNRCEIFIILLSKKFADFYNTYAYINDTAIIEFFWSMDLSEYQSLIIASAKFGVDFLYTEYREVVLETIEKAVPLFNSDNCHGDTFHYTSLERMEEAIRYWLWEYERKGFVRWSIFDRAIGEAVGTIELFHREAEDYFTECGLLRLDLCSDYEKKECIKEILKPLLSTAFFMFSCEILATKAVPEAQEGAEALTELGFQKRRRH